MNCNKVSHLLSAYMDGELLGHEHRIIYQHLKRCADCHREYEELLQMKRLLTAMRVREPGKRLATGILERVAASEAAPAGISFGDWWIPLPALHPRPVYYSPWAGLGAGLTVVGFMLWAHPARQVDATASNHRSLQFETADPTRDEPAPPHVAELTSGLMREAAPRQAAFVSTYPVNVPDFPLGARQRRNIETSFIRASYYR